MHFTELQKMFAVGIGGAATVCLCLVMYNRHRNKNVVYPLPAQTARVVLGISIFLELMRGILHFFFPYDCHKFISGLDDGFGISDNINAMTAFVLVTYEWGSCSLILAFMSMIPFLVNDSSLFLTTYALTVSLVGHLLCYFGLQTDVLNEISKNMPEYMKSYDTLENARKSPPGKHVARCELVWLSFGVVMAIMGQKIIRKANGYKKGDLMSSV